MKYIGLDLGTMHIVSAKSSKGNNGEADIKVMRNMFLPIDPTDVDSMEIAGTNLDYVEQKDENGDVEYLYIIGEDCFKFSTIFGQNIKRPMQNGVISPNEVDAIDILTLMIKKLIGKGPGVCVYSIPADPIDGENSSALYHSQVFNNILSSLNFEPKPINESMAVIYNECKDTKYSGIAFSFGCGLTNIACSWKGAPIFEFSIDIGGDWIDKEAGKSSGISAITRVTSLKERKLDFNNLKAGRNKKENRTLQALKFYYESLINHVLKNVSSHFNKVSENLDIDEPLPIIVSGGTSMPNGFLDLFKEVFNKQKDFPYDISEIRHAGDPLSSVASGSLRYAIHFSKNNKEVSTEKTENKTN